MDTVIGDLARARTSEKTWRTCSTPGSLTPSRSRSRVARCGLPVQSVNSADALEHETAVRPQR